MEARRCCEKIGEANRYLVWKSRCIRASEDARTAASRPRTFRSVGRDASGPYDGRPTRTGLLEARADTRTHELASLERARHFLPFGQERADTRACTNARLLPKNATSSRLRDRHRACVATRNSSKLFSQRSQRPLSSIRFSCPGRKDTAISLGRGTSLCQEESPRSPSTAEYDGGRIDE